MTGRTILAYILYVASAAILAPADDLEDRGRSLDALRQEIARQAEQRESLPRSPTVLGALRGTVVEPPAAYALGIEGDVQVSGYLFRPGYPLLHTDGGVAGENTALGMGALINSTPGVPGPFDAWRNTAIGFQALASTTTGAENTAIGASALAMNVNGDMNTAIGSSAMEYNLFGDENTAVGLWALESNTTGDRNTAMGMQALRSNTSGSGNVAQGFLALRYNETGSKNVAIGGGSLRYHVTGSFNTAAGYKALRDCVDCQHNTAIGAMALFHVDSHGYNTAVGARTLESSRRPNNIAIGYGAGIESLNGADNIFIGNEGQASSEEGVIRIGTEGVHTAAYLAGAFGGAVDGGTGAPLSIDVEGKIGTLPSSARYKENVSDLDDSSRALLELRPVSFRYLGEGKDGERSRRFGLIAEEVAATIPELVVLDAQGRPLTVRYELLGALLLNEYRRQDRRLDEIEQELKTLRDPR